MRKRVVIVLFMLLAVAALLFIVSCPEEITEPRDQDEDELTIESITIVDDGDGTTLVTLPAVGQTLKVKIKLSDDTYLDTDSDDIEITYKWFHKESPTITLSTDSLYEVTADSLDKIISVTVTVEDLGEDSWEATAKLVGISLISVVDGADGMTAVYVPEVGQVLRANIELSDGTKIYTHPADPRVSYKWVYAESSTTILGTEGSYTVTSDNVGNTIAAFVTVAGIGVAEWVADDVVPAETIEFNGLVSGIVSSGDGGVIDVTLTGDYTVNIAGNITSYDPDGIATFTGNVTGDIVGTIEATVDERGIDTLYGVITGTGADEPVRIIGYLPQTGITGDFRGKVITGTPKPAVTSIEVKDSDDNTEDFTVTLGETITLIAETTPATASSQVFWAVQISSRDKGEIGSKRKLTPNFLTH
jgi:hypothetical protein